MPLNDSSLILSELIEAVYGTVMDASRWPEVLGRIGRAVTGTQTLLFVTEEDGSGLALRCGETPDDVLHPFLQHYSSVNILSESCDRMFGDGAARFSHLALPDPVFEHSEFYQDFFRKNDLYYSMGVKCAIPVGSSTYLSIQRPWQLRPFVETDGAVAALLMPHINQALALQRRQQVQVASLQTAESALHVFGHTVLGVDGHCRIQYANAAAEEILRKGTLLYQTAGRLYARDPAANKVLQTKLRAVLDLDAATLRGKHETQLLQDPQGIADMRLIMLPKRVDVPGVHSSVQAVVSLSDQSKSALPRGTLLQSLYQLSATECRIADMLLQGRQTNEIADTLRLTQDTVRFYIKRSLSKTNTHRQSELLQLMLNLPGV